MGVQWPPKMFTKAPKKSTESLQTLGQLAKQDTAQGDQSQAQGQVQRTVIYGRMRDLQSFESPEGQFASGSAAAAAGGRKSVDGFESSCQFVGPISSTVGGGGAVTTESAESEKLAFAAAAERDLRHLLRIGEPSPPPLNPPQRDDLVSAAAATDAASGGSSVVDNSGFWATSSLGSSGLYGFFGAQSELSVSSRDFDGDPIYSKGFVWLAASDGDGDSVRALAGDYFPKAAAYVDDDEDHDGDLIQVCAVCG